MGRASKAVTATGELRRSKTGDARLLSVVTAGHAISHFLYQSFLVMLPSVRDALAIGPVQIGAIVTARQVSSGLAAVPGGLLCDRLRRHWGKVLAGCMAGFGLGWLVVGLSPGYGILIAGMVLLSVASAIWHLPAMAALSQRFSRRRGTALAIHGVGGNLGDVLGPVSAGLLLGYATWRGVLIAFAAIPLLLAFLVIPAFREEGQGEGAGRPDLGARAQWREMVTVLRNPTLWRINLVSGLREMCYHVYAAFLPLYFADELGFDTKAIGLHIGLLFSVGIIASPAMGYLSDRWGRKAILVPVLLGSCVLSVILALYGQGVALVAILALLGLFLRSDYSLLSATVLDIVGGQVATSTLGVMSFTTFLMGAVSPLIAGVLYERWGMDAALYFVAGLFAAGAIVLCTTRLETPTS